MNAMELVRLLGTTVLVRFDALSFECAVIDAKSAYGRIRLLVQPVSGCGQTWIEQNRTKEMGSN